MIGLYVFGIVMGLSLIHISPEERKKRLSLPKGKLTCVIDSDTYNEVDDQFAISYALLSPERLDVKAVYAAPFSSEFRCV